MVFSADGRVLIKVLRQKKGYGAKIHRRISLKPDLGELQERVYRSRIHVEVTHPDRRVGTFPPGVHR